LQVAIDSEVVRLGFTIFVLCFFLVYIVTHKNTSHHWESNSDGRPYDHKNIVINRYSGLLLVLCGFIGGTISGLIGSGADLVAFCVLALFFRIKIRYATQISVILMAAVSLFGIAMQHWVFNGVSAEVVSLWYIAAPVVLFGAPLGAVFCKHTTSNVLVIFIGLIVAAELTSTALLLRISLAQAPYFVLLFLTIVFCLSLLYRVSPYHRKADYKDIAEII
jgi:uncharacterized membrane protein YfcA